MTQKKAVLLGEPGSGKTMLSSYFALMLCQSDPAQISLDAKVDWLPIFVRIRDWTSKPEQGLLSYLRWDAEENLSIDNLPLGFFEHWLERGQALILLDGLDEVVNEAQRSKVSEKIETFLHRYQDNPAVITSRPAGYQGAFNLDEFPHYTLESFDDKQMETFIDHWYDSRLKDNKAQAERRKVDLQRAFARNERIRLLARNPLLLTLITLIHRDGGELPKQRYKLYERAVDILLIQWDCARDIKLDPKNNFFKPADLLYVLKKIAYWIHTQGSIGETEGGTLIDKDELIRQLRTEIKTLKKCELYEATAEAKRFIDFIKERTGLLNEQGIDRYAFVHKTFQEYLTAEEIYEADESGEDAEIIGRHFRGHLHDPHWREVLLLLVSKLKSKKAQNAIQTVLDANSKYEQWLHRDLLFAGWCLTEDPSRLTMVAADWVGEILDRLVALEVSNTKHIGSKIGIEVKKIVHCFAETTMECKVWEKLQKQEDRIGIFNYIELKIALLQQVEKIEIDRLLSFLDNKDSMLHHFAAITLGDIENPSPIVVNKLLSLIGNRCSGILSCALTLGKIGKINSTVVNHLILLLSDSDSDVRCGAAFALGQLENINSVAVNRLLSLLRDSSSDARFFAASALGQLKNTNPTIESGLILLLSDEDSSVRSSVASALGEIGNASPEVRSGLLSLLGDENSEVRCNAASALGQLENTNLAVENGLLLLLSDEDLEVRSSAASALGEIGNASPGVRSGLLSLLGDENSEVRCNAAEELGHLLNVNPAVVNSLLSLLDSKDLDVYSCAMAVFNQMGDANSDAMSKMFLLLEHPDLEVRFNATIILSYSGNTHPVLISILISFLSIQNWIKKSRVIEVLGNMGNVNPEIVDALISLIGDHKFVRMDVASALGKTEASSAVVSSLLLLLGDLEISVYSQAASSLVNLAKNSDIVGSEVFQWLEQNPNHDGLGNAIDCLWSIVVE